MARPFRSDRVREVVNQLRPQFARDVIFEILEVMFWDDEEDAWNIDKEWDSETLDDILQTLPQDIVALVRRRSPR